MSDPTRGITCPDMRKVVREALSNGWEWSGWTGSTHCKITWPKTGAELTFGSTPSVASWKTVATDIKKASGVTTWRKGNRKKSRKTFRDVDPHVQAQRQKYQEKVDGDRQLAYWCRLRTRLLEAQQSGNKKAMRASLEQIAKALRENHLTYDEWDGRVRRALREESR